MTEERIIRSIVMSAILVLGVVGCPSEPPDEPDAGIGGSTPTGGVGPGGVGSGGSATGGTAPVPVCAAVASLPAMGTACSSWGESQCDPNGNQCVCAWGNWYCSTNCAAKYPTEPVPGSACSQGEACTYPSGANCACAQGKWACLDDRRCPVESASSGSPCDGLSWIGCGRYRLPSSDLGMPCFCMPRPDACTGSQWACVGSAVCPATQPVYGRDSCSGYAACSYGSTTCACRMRGQPWVCGVGAAATVWLSMYPDKAPECGDGIADPDEACDDGNTAPGDGCSPTCQVEAGYACTGWGPGCCTRSTL